MDAKRTILAEGISELKVVNEKTKEVIAKVTEQEIDTCGDEIVVVIKPEKI